MMSGGQTIIGTGHRGMMNGGQTIVAKYPQKTMVIGGTEVTYGGGIMSGPGVEASMANTFRKPANAAEPRGSTGTGYRRARNAEHTPKEPRKIITAAEVIAGAGLTRCANDVNAAQRNMRAWEMSMYGPSKPRPSKPCASTGGGPSHPVEMVNAFRRGMPIQIGSVVRKLSIETSESTEDCDGLGEEKKLSYVRYKRNQQLMKSIMTDEIVLDRPSVVTQERLEKLRAQVAGLEAYQKEAMETQVLVDKHQAKLKAIADARAEHDEKFDKSSNRIGEAEVQRRSDLLYERLKIKLQEKRMEDFERHEAARRAAAAASLASLSKMHPALASQIHNYIVHGNMVPSSDSDQLTNYTEAGNTADEAFGAIPQFNI